MPNYMVRGNTVATNWEAYTGSQTESQNVTDIRWIGDRGSLVTRREPTMSNTRLHSTLSNISSVHNMLSQLSSEQWLQSLDLVRREIISLSELDFFGDAYPQAIKISTLFAVQKIAFHDAESGGAQDIGSWCLNRWLRLHEEDPRNVQTLRGKWQALYIKGH
jgi:hypothetical protein